MKRLTVDQVPNPQFAGDPRDENDPNRFAYLVVKVTNSTKPRIHQLLVTKGLDVCCDSDDWEVTIT